MAEPFEMASDRVYQDVTFQPDMLSSADARGVDFVHCWFTGSSVDTMFTVCRFEACDFFDGGFVGANFIQCDLSNVDVGVSTFDDCAFSDCNLNEARFVETSMFGSVFSRTQLRETKFLDCNLTFASFEWCDLSSIAFDDSDLSDADLSSCSGLTTAQLEVAVGNARTKLPRNVDRPEHWESEEAAEFEANEDLPAQQPAPLRLVWRGDRLVPDPRGGADDRLRNSAVFVLYRELSNDVRELASRPSNHPIFARLKQIDRCLQSGIAAINPVEVGYHGEVLRHQLPLAREELSADAASAIDGVSAGVGIFVAQFSEWREIAEAADSVSDGRSAAELATAMRDLASSVRKHGKLFDSRVADSLDNQADDVGTTDSARIKKGAVNSAGNVFSALGSRVWGIAKRGASVASEETLKVYIKQFIEGNAGPIAELVRMAPTSLGWLKAHLLKLFS